MPNLKKKKQWSWLGFEKYFMIGMMTLLILLLIGMIITFIVMGFTKHPVITGSIVGFFVLTVPVGYFVRHVLGWRLDEW
jgi:hypothetical protein